MDEPLSPWHDGERAVHRRLRIAEQIEPIGGRNIRPFMPDQHRVFFAQLPFLVAGSVDRAGRPWASILSGRPGFAASPDPRLLQVAAWPVAGDPLTEALVVGGRIALLGIELPTRRRNRLNGRIVAADGDGFAVAAEQSFGNCPQYIHLRYYGALRRVPAAAEPFTALPDDARALIARSDTCFVASATRAGAGGEPGSADVSHRGGREGFIGIDEAGVLAIPDYRGNRYFNTLGNLALNPRAGLLFIDFASGDLLQLTGTTEIVWDGPEVEAFAGAQRLWRLAPTAGNWLRGAFPLRMTDGEPAPQFSE